jgi:hypothetical protein
MAAGLMTRLNVGITPEGNSFHLPLKTILSTSRKRVIGGLYRQICARERKLREVFVIY